MRKALICAHLQFRVYLRSGRIIFPLLFLIACPALFYHVLPVDVVSSFSMSSVAAFAWGAWVSVSEVWSEVPVLRQILSVKVGRRHYNAAQNLTLSAVGALGGAMLIAVPLLASVAVSDMFVRRPLFPEVLLGALLNASAGTAGASLGAVFHPLLIHDRKRAYLLCLLIGLLGLVDGMAGFPLLLRVFLPPLYDTVRNMGASDFFAAKNALPASLWHLLYAAVCTAVRIPLLMKTSE